MAFRLEQEMHPPVLKWLQKQGLFVREEFSTPWGVCDFFAVSPNKRHVRNRVSLGQREPVGSLVRMVLLEMLPDVTDRRSARIEDLVNRSGNVAGMCDVEGELDKLVQRRFARRTRSGRYQKVNGWMPLHKRAVAVELKLSKTSDVLRQASANREFAGESYVAMPQEIAARCVLARNREKFALQGIGVLAVSRRACRVLLRPTSRRAGDYTPLEAYSVERLWRDFMKADT